MSGRKTVTIDSTTLAQLRVRAATATSLEASNRAMAALNARLSNSLDNANTRINTLNRNLNAMNDRLAATQQEARAEIAGLRHQLTNAVTDSNNRLAAQAAAHQQDMDSLRSDVANAMENNNRHMQAVMDENNRVINSRISAANNRIDQINAALAAAAGDQDLLLDMAQEFLGMANALNADSQTYRCELLLPGQLKEVLQAAANAEAQCNLRGNASAAQLDARNAYLEALAFHERIIEAEAEWIRRFQAAQLAVGQAEARIENSREVTHDRTGVRLDVNHWSDGDLEALERDAAALRSHLESGAQGDSLQDLDNIRTAGEHIDSEAIETVAFTLGAAENSQWRASIARLLGRSLKENDGLLLSGGGYQGGDSRGAHRMRLTHPHMGFEMVITQTPVIDENGQLHNRIETDIINPGSYNAATAHQLAQEIQGILAGNGIQAGALTTVDGCADLGSGRKETAEINQWRVEPVTTAVRPVRHHHRTQTATRQK